MTRPGRAFVRSVAIGVVMPLIAHGLTASTAEAATASSPIAYVYDAIGLLQAVIEPSGAAPAIAMYNYDNNGNLLSIKRTNPTDLTIIDFHGKTGSTGDAIAIYGTGFNSTPSQNKVTFTKAGGSGNNGAQATVNSASSTVLEVSVPTGAIAGSIWVMSTFNRPRSRSGKRSSTRPGSCRYPTASWPSCAPISMRGGAPAPRKTRSRGCSGRTTSTIVTPRWWSQR